MPGTDKILHKRQYAYNSKTQCLDLVEDEVDAIQWERNWKGRDGGREGKRWWRARGIEFDLSNSLFQSFKRAIGELAVGWSA